MRRLEQLIAEDMGFSGCVPVSGQTYSRKVDAYFLGVLSGFAQSACKFANDLRLLQSFSEVEEPFGKKQVGSSAMPYKRNPMRSERICALARYVMMDSLNPAVTASTQWFERTLDDSANKRIAVAEAFLVVYEPVIRSRVMEKLPFMATENVMMESVKRGGNRQALHEVLRELSQAAATRIKSEGAPNDLIDRMAADARIPLAKEEILDQMAPEKYIGRSVAQVEEFLADCVQPLLDRYYAGDVAAALTI